MAGAARGGAGSATVTYRAQLSDRVLGQLDGFPAEAFDALIATMSEVVEYPDDPMRGDTETCPLSEPRNRLRGAVASGGCSGQCDSYHDAKS